MTPARRREICDRLAAGETLRRICAPPDMPSRVTVLRAIAKNAAFRADYEEARELQVAQLAEELLEIADGRADEEVEPGSARQARENIQRARLRVEVRKWLLGRQARPSAEPPRKQSGSGDLLDFSELTAEEREGLRAILARRLGRSGGGPQGAGSG